MTYQVLIIEDEKHSQALLSGMLQEHFPEFRLAGIASTINEGRTLIEQQSPDLVFLDVKLPPYTSFDLLSTLKEITFEIIFTTSFEEYAMKAFRLSAVDYLLKPVSQEYLTEALEKFKVKRNSTDTRIHIKTLLENINSARTDNPKIALPSLTGFIFVPVKNVLRCESDNTYTTFFLTDKRKIVVSKTLKECEQLLSDFNFWRVHNSHLINLDFVSEYIKGEGGIVTMSDGSQVDVSRRRKDEFLARLKKS